MSDLPPFVALTPDERPVAPLALAPEAAALYGPLAFPPHPGRPYVIANFVATVDGVVTLGPPHPQSSAISGKNMHDRFLMGLLRAVSDAVVVAAGTLRVQPRQPLLPAAIAPQFAGAYVVTREGLGKRQPPLTVVVTSGGDLDLTLPVFQSGQTEVCIVGPAAAAEALRRRELPPQVRVVGLPGEKTVSSRAIVGAVQAIRPCDIILCEGGPHLLGGFLDEGALDELFLTVAPQVAGRDDGVPRPGFVAGYTFAPERPLWATLTDVRRAGDVLFLRYAFGGRDGERARAEA